MSEFVDVEQCDHRARCFVCGTTRDKEGNLVPRSGEWHSRFKHHPWVQQSTAEDWARDLRGVVIMNLKRRMFREQKSFDYKAVDIESLMPDGKWIDDTRKKALVELDAVQWRKESGFVPGAGWKDTSKRLADVTSDAFRAMQIKSPNQGLHRESIVKQRIDRE